MLLVLLATLTQARTVCNAGCDFIDLSGAMANVYPGEVLTLGDGTWVVNNLRIPVDLTIRAMNPGQAFIQPLTDQYAFLVDSPLSFTLEDVAFEYQQARIVHSTAAADIAIHRIDVVEVNPEGSLIALEAGGSLTMTDSTFVGYMHNPEFPAGGGAVLYAGGGANVTWSNVDIEGGAAQRGGAVRLANAVAAFDSVTITDASSTLGGGAIYVNPSSTLVVTNSAFRDNRSVSGGAIEAMNLDVLNSEFEDNVASYGRGGAIFVYNGPTGVVSGSTFTNNRSTDDGGAIAGGWGVPLDVSDSQFVANHGASGGAIAAFGPADHLISNNRFHANEATALGGGAIALQYIDGASTIEHATFTANTAPDGGALYVAGAGLVNLVNSRLCANEALYVGGGLYVDFEVGYQHAVTVTNTLFHDNLGPDDAGALYADPQVGQLILRFNDFLANRTVSGNASALGLYQADIEVRNNLFGWNSGGQAAVWADGNDPKSGDYNAWWQNTPADDGGGDPMVGPEDVFEDPLLTNYDPSLLCGSLDIVPLVDSPLIDAGDPSLFDADGTRSDIGVTAGPGSDTDPGWDPNGQNDNPYSGLPTGTPPVDADGDGWPADVDCNDDNALIHPGAEEDYRDKVDNNCDGKIAQAWLGGRRCDGTGGSPGLFAWLPLLLIRRRARR